MAVQFVQKAPTGTMTPTKQDGNATVEVTFGSQPTVGNTIIVFWAHYGIFSFTGVTDNQGNGAYTLADGTTNCVRVYYKKITSTGTPFTITGTSAACYGRFCAIEFSGVGTLGTPVSATAFSTAWSTGAFGSTGDALCVSIGTCTDANSSSLTTTDSTEAYNEAPDITTGVIYNIGAGPQTHDWTATATSNWETVGVPFAEESGVGHTLVALPGHFGV